jgi:hypothetical protein
MTPMKGSILLKNHDSISGFIKINYELSYKYILLMPFYKYSERDIVFVNKDSIQEIVVHSLIDSAKLIHYKSLYYGHPWLVLKEKDSIGIYEGFFYGGRGEYSKVILYNSKTQRKSTINNDKKTFGSLNPRKYFLRFINHRYNQHFDKNSFKNEEAMMDYIISKEIISK